MLRVAFFYTLLFGVAALTFWKGRADERLAAIICMVGTGLTVLAGDELPVRFADFDTFAFIVDLGVLLSFLWIALRSDRYWPIWVTGLQLTATTIHPMMFLSPELVGRVFGAAVALWSYPILFIIAIGTVRTHLVERWRAEADIASGRLIT